MLLQLTFLSRSIVLHAYITQNTACSKNSSFPSHIGYQKHISITGFFHAYIIVCLNDNITNVDFPEYRKAISAFFHYRGSHSQQCPLANP